MNNHKYTESIVRMMGVLTLLLSCAFLVLYTLNTDARAQGGRDLTGFLYYSIYGLVVGIGQLFCFRIASVMLSIPLALLGAWLIIGSLTGVPFPWFLLNIIFGLFLFVPMYVTINSWLVLRPIWRKGEAKVIRSTPRR